MEKLIAKFLETKSQAAADKLRAYNKKHPFAVCVLLPADIAALAAHGFTF